MMERQTSSQKTMLPGHEYLLRKKRSLNFVDFLAKRESGGCSLLGGTGGEGTSLAAPSQWTRSLLDSRLEHSPTFYYKDLFGHFGCVNTVEFSADGVYLASGGDCRRLLLWNVWDAVHKKKYVPAEMKTTHSSNIFCVSFDSTQKRLYSGGNDELVIIHNIETGDSIEQIGHMDDVYGLSVDPSNNNVFVSASNEITLWDIRSPTVKSTRLATGSGPFHAVMHSPTDNNLLVTANSKEGVAVYDSRKPLSKLLHFYSSSVMSSQGAMCVRFNRAGRLILALRRKQSPVLYDIRSPYPLVEFDSADYYNSCTLKNCCFVGKDEGFVASGSDNFKVYIWKVPEAVMEESSLGPLRQTAITRVPQATQILNGHRSIVNHVRFNEQTGMIASTGVEKVVKLWSPLVQFEEAKSVQSQKFTLESQIHRNVYTHRDYINLVHGDRLYTAHDYSSSNTGEDRRMIAYFDSMIEREINNVTLIDSSDNESPSYFSILMNKELDFSEHLKTCDSMNEDVDDEEEEEDSQKLENGQSDKKTNGVNKSAKNEDPQMSFLSEDLSMDSDETFALQKRFNFYAGALEPKRLSGDGDHLAYVFSKRMHAKYLQSYVDGLIAQVLNLDCVAEERKKREAKAAQKLAEEMAASEGRKLPPKAPVKCHRRSSSLFLWISPQHLLENINEQIKGKKENELIFFAYKFSKSLLTSFHFGTLFNVRRHKSLQTRACTDDSESRRLDLNCKETVQAQIRAMARITTTTANCEEKTDKQERHLHDRRLYDALTRLYKRIIYLLNLLSDSTYDIKSKRKEFLRELHPHTVAHRYHSRALNFAVGQGNSSSSSDSSMDIADDDGGILLESIGREMLAETDEEMTLYRRRLVSGGSSISSDSVSTNTLFTSSSDVSFTGPSSDEEEVATEKLVREAKAETSSDSSSSSAATSSSSSETASSSSSSSSDTSSSSSDDDGEIEVKKAVSKKRVAKSKKATPTKSSKAKAKKSSGKKAASAEKAGPSTSKEAAEESSDSSGGFKIFFKKSNRSNKNFKDSGNRKRKSKKRSQSTSSNNGKKHRKVCKHKRQRKS